LTSESDEAKKPKSRKKEEVQSVDQETTESKHDAPESKRGIVESKATESKEAEPSTKSSVDDLGNNTKVLARSLTSSQEQVCIVHSIRL